MRKKFWRTRFLTGSPIQLRYLALLMVSMLVPIIFVGACLYYLIFNILAEQLGIPEYIAYNLLPAIQKINVILMIGVPPLVLVLFTWGVILSHRLIGPIERLKREIDAISAEGNYGKRVHLRKYDDVKPIADSINKLLDRIEGKHK